MFEDECESYVGIFCHRSCSRLWRSGENNNLHSSKLKLQKSPLDFGLLTQGDADYLRYRGMQEFDQAMQHLEERFGVSPIFLPPSSIVCVNGFPWSILYM